MDETQVFSLMPKPLVQFPEKVSVCWAKQSLDFGRRLLLNHGDAGSD